MSINGVHNNNLKSSGQLLLEFINTSAENVAELRKQRREAYIKRQLEEMVAKEAEKPKEDIADDKVGEEVEVREENIVKTEDEKDRQKRIDKKV